MLTNTAYHNSYPEISDNRIIWNGANLIMLYDGSSISPFAGKLYSDYTQKRISGTKIAWFSDTLSYYPVVYYYNGIKTSKLTSDFVLKSSLQMSNGNIIWKESNLSNLYFSDGTTNRSIGTATGNAFISNDTVVWETAQSGLNYVYRYIRGVSEVIDNSTAPMNLVSSGKYMVFNKFWNGKDELNLVIGSTKYGVILNSSETRTAMTISGQNLVYIAKGSSNQDQIFFCGLSATLPRPVQITNFTSYTSITNLQIDNNKVIWLGAGSILWVAKP
jgi:hypothetical protein